MEGGGSQIILIGQSLPFGNRTLVFDKDGHFIHSYEMPNLTYKPTVWLNVEHL